MPASKADKAEEMAIKQGALEKDTAPLLPTTMAANNFKAEGTTKTFVAMLLLGTGLIAAVVGSGISALKYVGVCGVLSGAMWMPYLIALMFFNTDSGKPFSGVYKKLAYAPLPAPTPPWVKRAMVGISAATRTLIFSSAFD